MRNTLTISEIKRRGMSAISEHLRAGPTQIVKTKKPGIALNEAGSLDRSVFSCICKAPASWSKLALVWILARLPR